MAGIESPLAVSRKAQKREKKKRLGNISFFRGANLARRGEEKRRSVSPRSTHGTLNFAKSTSK